MNRRLATRLGRLEEAAGTQPGDEPPCVHHGPICEMGAQPLPALYVAVIEAKQRAGEEVPPLDEHRLATPAERAHQAREAAELLAEQRAKNEATLQQLREERGHG